MVFSRMFGALRRVLTNSRRGPARAAPQPIRITEIGGIGAGKTTLVQGLIQTPTDHIAPRGISYFIEPTGKTIDVLGPHYPNPTTEPTVLYDGWIRIDGEERPLELLDTQGGLLLEEPPPKGLDPEDYPPLYQASCNCDLLILALAPEAVEQLPENDRLLRHMLSHLHLATRNNPELMVAIAFTKADEYGSSDPLPMRVVSGRRAMRALRRLRRDRRNPAALETFLRQAARHSAGPHPILTQLMNNTRQLWLEVVNWQSPRAGWLNGYCLAAKPARGLLRGWSQPGIVPLFGDFFEHLRHTRSKPRLGSARVLLSFALGLATLAIGITSFERGTVIASAGPNDPLPGIGRPWPTVRSALEGISRARAQVAAELMREMRGPTARKWSDMDVALDDPELDAVKEDPLVQDHSSKLTELLASLDEVEVAMEQCRALMQPWAQEDERWAPHIEQLLRGFAALAQLARGHVKGFDPAEGEVDLDVALETWLTARRSALGVDGIGRPILRWLRRANLRLGAIDRCAKAHEHFFPSNPYSAKALDWSNGARRHDERGDRFYVDRELDPPLALRVEHVDGRVQEIAIGRDARVDGTVAEGGRFHVTRTVRRVTLSRGDGAPRVLGYKACDEPSSLAALLDAVRNPLEVGGGLDPALGVAPPDWLADVRAGLELVDFTWFE
ncbi:MAG: hypothetical protein GY711_15075 [bacterium]|nr:hypothetical protein [bacterium]